MHRSKRRRLQPSRAWWARPCYRGVERMNILQDGGARRVLITGHDLKFILPLIQRLERSDEYHLRVDEHSDHAMTATDAAKAALPWADTIFCEWAMGNAVWFSRHKRRRQRLLVRLHLQEIQARMPFLWKIDWAAVDVLICICHHTYDWMCAEFPAVRGKAVIVYNPIDARGALSLPKMPHSEFNIGFVGMVPQRKRVEIAFDILRALKTHDERYTLHIKGRQPHEYPWMLTRQEEMTWYDSFQRRIEASPYRNSVIYDAHGTDMPAWYSGMGFILSTSDFEGSHQAIAEGMAAGCIPVIRDWEGADRIYPRRFQFHSSEEAAGKVRHWHRAGVLTETARACRAFACARFDNGVIVDTLVGLLSGEARHSVVLPKRRGAAGRGIAVLGFLQPGARNGYRIRIEQEIKRHVEMAGPVSLVVLYQEGSPGELDAHARELEALGCRVRLVPIAEFFAIEMKLDKVLPALQEIERIIAEDEVDILHAEALYCARVACMLAPRCPNLTIVFDNHGVSPEEEAMTGAHPNRVRAVERLEQQVLAQADLTLYVSNQMAAHYEGKYALPPIEHVILPCCVEAKFFCDRPVRDLPALLSRRTVIGYVGTLAAWQCGPDMLSLFAQLQRRDPTLFLLLLTPAREHGIALAAASDAGIQADSILVREVQHDQVPSYLQHVDIGLLLRRDHPVNLVSSPTKFAEYLAAGVPVLMTGAVGDYSSQARTNRLGFVVEARKVLSQPVPGEVIDQILAFVHDVRRHRDGWRQRCRDYARSNLSWDACMARLYDRLDLLAAPTESDDLRQTGGCPPVAQG